MRWHEAMSLLGLEAATASADAVRRAYAAKVMADHPDYGGPGTGIARLQEARDTLLISEQPPRAVTTPCKLCRGVGQVRSRFGVQACTACKGSGDRL